MNKSRLVKACLSLLLVMPIAALGSENIADEDFCLQLKSARKDMNRILLEVQHKKQGDHVFLRALKKSQKKWLEYVAAAQEMQFPSGSKLDYGTVLGTCTCIKQLDLVQSRIAELREWLEPIEGDVCTGSKG